MGYTKVVQYGNITEIYEYENDHRKKQGIDAFKATRLATGASYPETGKIHNVKKHRARVSRLEAKRKGVYRRSAASVARSKVAFFRLVHHNNIIASSIHFVTLTFTYDLEYKAATRCVSEFFRRIRSVEENVSISYISVAELTKKGRYHFHLLVYNLPPETAERERKTRNIQRQFQRGYVDVVRADYLTTGIAGYMAKYMAKSLTDERYETTRGFNSSQNIGKPTSAGSNTLGGYLGEVVPTDNIADVEEREYDVPYLGKCRFTKLTKIQ